jgi:trk/ktr system potassium uptake protein
MKIILVGAGATTREVLRRLGDQWEVAVVDTDLRRFDRIGEIREFEAIVGDGSSELVLSRAGLEEAHAVVAATGYDDVNLACIKIAVEAGVIRVVGTAIDPSRSDEYTDAGAHVVAPSALAARQVEISLEPRRVASTAFAGGKAEAIEFYIGPDTPVAGKRLRDLHSETWVIAAVLRDDRLIVPHGGTQILAGDRVTVVGSAADFAAIIATFTSGESRFPEGYGRRVAVAIESEADIASAGLTAVEMVRSTRADSLLVVQPDTGRDTGRQAELDALVGSLIVEADGIDVEVRATTEKVLMNGLAAVSGEESVGLIVARAPTRGGLLGRLQAVRVLNVLGSVGVPVMFVSHTASFNETYVLSTRSLGGEAAARVAIDLAKALGTELTGVGVVPPTFVAGVDEMGEARAAAAWLREEASVQSVSVHRRIRRGNPVRVIEELTGPEDLVVVPMPTIPVHLSRSGIAAFLLGRISGPLLVVPVPA